MKSIVSMIAVLAVTLLFSTQVQAGYADGMNQYAAYHVMHGIVDPMGTNTVSINGEVPANGPVRNTLAWRFDVPQSTLQCEEGEVLVYEYKVMWQIIGDYSYVPNEGGDYSGVGDYHVTFEDWFGEMQGVHNVHVGSGTGRVHTRDFYIREYLQQWYPNFGNLAGDERRQVVGEARDYARDRLADAVAQRDIRNTSGDFSYEVTAHCVCEPIDWNDAFAQGGPGVTPGDYRGNTEFADSTHGPTRFRTAEQYDLRVNSRWLLGSPSGEITQSENVASGGFRFNFGDRPDNGSISTY